MTSTDAISPDTSGNTASQCFVVVKYGDNKEALLNPWCSTQIFVDSIKRKCQCDSNSTLDLVDLEGQIKNLSLSSDEYASDYVTGRETYVAIKVERQGENGPHKYIPLLNRLEETHPQLMVKLNNLSRPGAKNRKDRLKRTQNRPSRTNSNKPEIKPRPSSSERQGENGPHKYIPLLNRLEETHPQLMVKLNNLSRPGAKNRKDRLKRTQNRPSRTNSNKPEIKPRPSSSERGSKSRQGK